MDDYSHISTHAMWWLIALLLVGSEMLAPGYFLLWIGLAAGAMGVLTWMVPGLGFIVQTVIFAVLAIGICTFYWKVVRPRAERRDDQPLLNDRTAQLIGQHFQVSDAIVHGRGKVRINDSVWLAEGDDAAIGETVVVTAVNGTTLSVKRA
ncbi:MAG: NfeD family protein [Dokdonella sp.]